MRTVLLVLSTILLTMNMFSQNKSTDREPVAAGRFYSASAEALKSDLSQLFTKCVKPPAGWNVRAIISPHAGYVFSGGIAASAFSSISKNSAFKNIFIIGSSHIMAFDGASVYNTGDFVTPLGKIKVNKEIANKLKSESKYFNFPVDSHSGEHSIEVQIPFIQYLFKGETQIVPIIIGATNLKTIRGIATELKQWFTPENLFIISSDFAHYPPYKEAVEVDNNTANAIVSKNPETFLKTLDKNSSMSIPGLATSMCGWTSGLTLLYLAEGDPKLEFKRISYCNSGDSQYGNKNEVVGYHAIALISNDHKSGNQKNAEPGMSFNKEETAQLIDLARLSIRSMLFENKRLSIDPDKLPESFKNPWGAFVTLKINGVLRGCIGRFISADPLYKVVIASALSSAFEDTRFTPLTKQEFEKISIEISVLGPMKKINNINEIVLGKHGIYIKKDFRSGTMLPQVATEYKWNVEEFLGYTSRDKAGIGWLGWKDAEIFIYEAAVLEENKK
jgi:AmmeMemoRadiSam system protein B/AmmeMemoRadiSam system protein A